MSLKQREWLSGRVLGLRGERFRKVQLSHDPSRYFQYENRVGMFAAGQRFRILYRLEGRKVVFEAALVAMGEEFGC